MAMKKPRDSPARSPSPSLAHTHSLPHTLTLSHTHSLSHTLTLAHTHSLSHALSLTHTLYQEKIMAMKKPRDVTCVDTHSLTLLHTQDTHSITLYHTHSLTLSHTHSLGRRSWP